MFIYKLKVFNYKSYLDSGLIEFTPGINIIVGQNNSGKTSLLEALTLNFDNQPHLSLETLPDKSSIIKEQSIIEVYLTLEKKELRSFIQQSTSPVGIHASPEIYFNDEDNPRERHEISLRHNFEIFRDFLE
ncbi:MAG: AAA family ATPase [Nostoc sp.]|uniref:AAA family ATPase n=1 Tax=Nostoc sp. TaxID=1180 RepID=UPI002FF74C24